MLLVCLDSPRSFSRSEKERRKSTIEIRPNSIAVAAASFFVVKVDLEIRLLKEFAVGRVINERTNEMNESNEGCGRAGTHDESTAKHP